MKNPYLLAETVLRSTADQTDKKESATFRSTFNSIDLYGSSVLANDEGDDLYRRFHLENESGVGDIALYRVFPGIELVYNDMHMAYCNRHQQPAPDVMEINYCKEGRCECLFSEQQYCYMSAGDLSFCSLRGDAHQSGFPTSHYHGITITIDFSGITEEMQHVLTLLSVDVARIKALSEMRDFTMIHANQTTDHIFQELYTVPEKIRHGYIRVKVLELLLVLTTLDAAHVPSSHDRFSAGQIEAIKQVHAFLIAHFNEHYTIDMLSERFDLSPTVLKKCFKGVYGESVYAYLKHYRLQAAAQLLRETSLTIGEIADRIGYLNPNKFTSAFCTEYGLPPTSYRRQV